MNREIFKKRQFYFGFLFSSFIYFGILMLILKKINPFSPDLTAYSLMISGSVVPGALFFLKKKGKKLKNYIYLLSLGHIPLIVGFFLSLFYKNFGYFLLMFPVFVLGYLVLIPLEEKKDGLHG